MRLCVLPCAQDGAKIAGAPAGASSASGRGLPRACRAQVGHRRGRCAGDICTSMARPTPSIKEDLTYSAGSLPPENDCLVSECLKVPHGADRVPISRSLRCLVRAGAAASPPRASGGMRRDSPVRGSSSRLASLLEASSEPDVPRSSIAVLSPAETSCDDDEPVTSPGPSPVGGGSVASLRRSSGDRAGIPRPPSIGTGLATPVKGRIPAGGDAWSPGEHGPASGAPPSLATSSGSRVETAVRSAYSNRDNADFTDAEATRHVTGRRLCRQHTTNHTCLSGVLRRQCHLSPLIAPSVQASGNVGAVSLEPPLGGQDGRGPAEAAAGLTTRRHWLFPRECTAQAVQLRPENRAWCASASANPARWRSRL